MVFRRRTMGLRPINRIKHVFDVQFGQVVANTATNTIVTAVQSADPLVGNECETGSTINGFYIKLEAIASSSGALPNFYFYLAKNVGGNLSLPAGNLVGASDNKKFVIHQEMVMFQKQTNSNPRTVFQGVIAVPRHLRRMSPNDRWDVVTTTVGVTIEACMQVHFKEFR